MNQCLIIWSILLASGWLALTVLAGLLLTANRFWGFIPLNPFSLLRAACPCAQCRGGHENMKSEPDAEVFTRLMEDSLSTRISNIVGCWMPGSLAIRR